LRILAPAALALCGALAGPQPLAAQTVEQFYRGRSIELLTTAPGGRYDLSSRLIARHLGDFLPGRPKVIVQVEAGAGGLTVANRLANTSARDGSVLALTQPGAWQVAIEGDPNARFDPARMTWIGSMSSFANDADLLIVRAGHPAMRAAALRGAFAAMMRDPDFIADVRKANVELSPIDGEAIARLIAKSAATPKEVIRRYNAIVGSPR
jgi:tripartite-type tricarboxylate transporter receptor subunit TctC